jgi:hypothetical protein
MNCRYLATVFFTLFWLFLSAGNAMSQPMFTHYKIAIAHQESSDKKVLNIASHNAPKSEDEESGDSEQVDHGKI